MVEVIWTDPAVAELDSIADYIAFDDPLAAKRLVQRIILKVEQLKRFPQSGSRVPEWPKSIYRQLVINPCRLFYRYEDKKIFIVFVMRHERLLKKSFLKKAKFR